jgi:hypothetical protein
LQIKNKQQISSFRLITIVLLVLGNFSLFAQTHVKTTKEILAFSDSVCRAAGVPAGLIREIGNNETGWRFIRDFSGGSAHGDLQIVDNTFNHWYKKLNLKGGRTRENYLIVGIYYIKSLHKTYGSWQKARYAYARGHWKEPSKWTAMERKFMNKIDWSQYDIPKIVPADTFSR